MKREYFLGEFKTSESPKDISVIRIINHFFEAWPEGTHMLLNIPNEKLRLRTDSEMHWIAKDAGLEIDEAVAVVIRDGQQLYTAALYDDDGLLFKYNAKNKTIEYDLFTQDPKVLRLMELCGEDLEIEENNAE